MSESCEYGSSDCYRRDIEKRLSQIELRHILGSMSEPDGSRDFSAVIQDYVGSTPQHVLELRAELKGTPPCESCTEYIPEQEK